MNDSFASSNQTCALVVAAGQGSRSGLDKPKQFEVIKGKPMLRHSVQSFLSHPLIDQLWIAHGDGQDPMVMETISGLANVNLVLGGKTRQDSVRHGLAAIRNAGGAANILIHDAARPFLSHDVIDRLVDALENNDGAIPVLPTIDTITTLSGSAIDKTVDRDRLWRVQTPQAFDFDKLILAHENWPRDKTATDDAQIFGSAGHAVTSVPGDESLRKYTTSADFKMASGEQMNQIRTGMGYDVHRLVSDEELWLGGIKIDHDKGLAGHSDADVLLHALTDALLGAAGAGDIGDHFPPSDPQWRGASSDKFAKFAASVITEKGGSINNVDMTIICEAPKIKPHRETIRNSVADILDISLDRVSVKATTTEGLGFSGRKEGIAAQAIATITINQE